MQIDNRIRDQDLIFFRFSLLSTVLLTAFGMGSFIAILGLFDVLPLSLLYTILLYGYSMVNLIAYYLLQKKQKNYFLSVHIATFSSLFLLTVMTVTVQHDEFRLVWFFLTSFASFILGGKRYGLVITTIIIGIVLYLYNTLEINLSSYAIFTFIIALFVFNIFSFYFLKKIENDSKILEDRVIEEVQKQQLQEQMLLRQYRMAHMGEMIDAIAHQWRQPLMQTNMILLNMDDCLDEDDSKEYIRKKIIELTGVTAHMSQTIDDFRNLLKDGKSKTLFQIDEVIYDTLKLLKKNLKGINVTYIKNNRQLIGYKNELIQVLIIFLSNSIEALKNIEEKNIYITTESDETMLLINIEDSGSGIKNSVLEKIFDPYFTTKKQSGGTGLGLYIAKIIIEQNMQGNLSVQNSKEGARFTITIKKEL
ncbi:HAMP domain-containing histidine kinase [bacterium]|nr:HAMP domain-containing histidine kinase [bacterium]MBU1956944.1 HAMP domain-containing histidine kinase [bacterium]